MYIVAFPEFGLNDTDNPRAFVVALKANTLEEAYEKAAKFMNTSKYKRAVGVPQSTRNLTPKDFKTDWNGAMFCEVPDLEVIK